MSKTITSDELETLLSGHKPPRVIDVRRKSDYEGDPSMIPGAVWLDPEKVEDWGKELGDKNVVIYCVRGGSVMKDYSIVGRKWPLTVFPCGLCLKHFQ